MSTCDVRLSLRLSIYLSSCFSFTEVATVADVIPPRLPSPFPRPTFIGSFPVLPFLSCYSCGTSNRRSSPATPPAVLTKEKPSQVIHLLDPPGKNNEEFTIRLNLISHYTWDTPLHHHDDTHTHTAKVREERRAKKRARGGKEGAERSERETKYGGSEIREAEGGCGRGCGCGVWRMVGVQACVCWVRSS